MTKSIQHTMSKNGLILAVFALATTGLIALTYFGTKDQIAIQQQQKLLSILHAVIDENAYDNAIQFDCALVTSKSFLGSDEPHHVYRATKLGQGVAAAIETTAPDGYSGKIEIVVGVTHFETGTAKVTGVRVLEHKETPGLGDKIDLRVSNWVLDFDNQIFSPEIAPNWAVKKDGGQFDQFTGATVTPRAVVKAVKLSVEYFLANQDAIFNAPNACNAENPPKISDPIGEQNNE
ncbi:MAG: electron transport complex subunit RsxG [Paraglaciecola sp.]|uniref:electron transport complex subunit RsxG n=1 Tax=Paraglaciecola sp. TaxID=1920173 RepID=UPI00329A2471